MTIETCPVSSYNEWDLLEEVIVGNVKGAAYFTRSKLDRWVMSEEDCQFIEEISAKSVYYSEEIVAAAEKSLKGFIHILESEGVIVRQVPPIDHGKPYSTPAWESPVGFCAANPRDVFLTIGNDIIEAPMCDRNRYFEAWSFRPLLLEYFRAGAKWTAAPKPQLLDEQYNWNVRSSKQGETLKHFAVNEFEPVFDAADFVRCGRDIFGQRSHVTNQLGIDWLQRHLGDEYRIHILESIDPYTVHIDTSFMPLAPGKVLVNPEFINIETLPDILKSWDILVAPQPNYTPKVKYHLMSDWIGVNVLMLDEKRVVVEKSQEVLIKALKDWGFETIPCEFENYYPFWGSFHCATLDVRRKGTLQSYF